MNTELFGQTKTVTQFSGVGKISIRGKTIRSRKPAWLVLTKFVGLILILSIAWVLRPEEFGKLTGAQGAGLFFLLLLVYVAVSHFVVPKANTDNLGIGGMIDDKFQYYDDINRGLLQLHVALGPGRYIASTISDVLLLFGLLPERSQDDIEQVGREKADNIRSAREAELMERVNAEFAAKGTYALELDPSRYMTSAQVTEVEPIEDPEPQHRPVPHQV